MIGENIKKYRNIRSMSLRDLASVVGVTQTAIAKYENNELVPDGDRLMEIARALSVSVADLMKPQRKNRPIKISYRKSHSLSRKSQTKLEILLQDKINDYLDVLDLLDERPAKIVKYTVSNISEAEEAALHFRLCNNLNDLMPMTDLTSIVENLGINLIYLNDEDGVYKGFFGVSEIIEEHPFICLTRSVNLFKHRFTLAHELGHLVLDVCGEVDEEEACDAFASSLLLPNRALLMKFGEKRSSIDWQEFIEVQREYGISIKTAIYRLHRQNVISDGRCKTYNIMFNKLSKDYESLISTNEQTSKYKMMVYRLRGEGIITESRFQELLGGDRTCEII